MRAAHWAMIAVALASAPSLGAEDRQKWLGELRLDIPGTLSYSWTTGVSTSDSNFQITPKLTATFYAEPLVDDPNLPLQLLTFFQKPDTFSAILSGVSSIGGSAMGTVYPWAKTGLTASAGFSLTDATGSVGASFLVGALYYATSHVRLELDYLGSRGRSVLLTSLSGSAAPDRFQDSDSSTNRGRLTVNGVLNPETLQLVGMMEFGDSHGSSASSDSLGFISLYGYRGPIYTLQLTLNGFPQRDLSLGLTGGLRGQSRANDKPDGSTSYTAQVTPYGSLAFQYFPVDRFFVRGSYELDWTYNSSSTAPTGSVAHLVTFTGGLRL